VAKRKLIFGKDEQAWGAEYSRDILIPKSQDPIREKRDRYLSNRSIGDLSAPGIPSLPPNSDFVSMASAEGDADAAVIVDTSTKDRTTKGGKILKDLVKGALYGPRFLMNVNIGPHRDKLAHFVAGHLWKDAGIQERCGPQPARVMVLNKMPNSEDVTSGHLFAGEDGRILAELVTKLQLNAAEWYVTNLCKFAPPNRSSRLKASWIKDSMHLLHHELKLVRPDFILCLGSDPSKALLGSSATVGKMEGKVSEYVYNLAFTNSQNNNQKLITTKTAKVMSVVSPKAVIRDKSVARQLESGLGRFGSLLRGIEVGEDEQVDHRHIYQDYELWELLLEMEESCHEEGQDNVIAVDGEWNGNRPNNHNSYLRTIQIAWQPKKAAGIVVNTQGNSTPSALSETQHPWREWLVAFFNGGTCKDPSTGATVSFIKKRTIGHFFNADLEWLVSEGIDIQDSYSCHLRDVEFDSLSNELKECYRSEGFQAGSTVPAWYRTKYEGGADTGLMAHAVEETASYKLETLAMRFTSAPRYDGDLVDWRTEYCKSEGIQNKELDGYGECPDSILLPYGIYDADVTLRLFYALDVLLDEDFEGNNCREPFWESHIATPAILEIHKTGLVVDLERIDRLTVNFIAARERLAAELRKELCWPEFSIRSYIQVKEFLFGTDLNGKRDKVSGKPVRVRPEGAMSLGLTPVFNTDKPPKPWREVIQAGKQKESSPSTDKQSLALLARNAGEGTEKQRLVKKIMDFRFLDQVLKTVLRVPESDEEGDNVFSDDGNLIYSEGLAASCCDDGRVRTTIFPTKETGRWASARPNLQNISKKRDPDYKRLLGDGYVYSLRSVLKAGKGKVLIEADFIGAELFGMAVMSGDEKMIDHAQRNQLPDTNPDHYDIHSNVAVQAFNLNCPPTKKGLSDAGMKHIRIVAKSVIFGIAYGRGANAISTEAKASGHNVSKEEAQAVIDAIYAMYPRLAPFFAECQARATGKFVDPETKQAAGRFLVNCYGRFRRFPVAIDQKMEAEFERQAMNYPMQSMVASAMSRAIAYLHDYKMKKLRDTGLNLFDIVLQVHDALIFEVEYRYVKFFCELVLPNLMRNSVPIYPTTLDGVPTGSGPFYMGLEGDVMHHWGDALSYAEAEACGLPTGVSRTAGCIVNYSKEN
jgi:uracil-DNA glycosylase family 4